jgi:hypothetical protein
MSPRLLPLLDGPFGAPAPALKLATGHLRLNVTEGRLPKAKVVENFQGIDNGKDDKMSARRGCPIQARFGLEWVVSSLAGSDILILLCKIFPKMPFQRYTSWPEAYR